MWAGTYAPEDKMKNMIVFSKYTVKGMRDSWFVEEGKGAEYIKDWQEILKILDDGTKKKVVIYPMAESQVLDNSRVQQALSFARRADVAQAQLERLSDLDGYDLSNLTFFPTAGDAALTRQNLAMLENLRDHQQEVEVPSITGDNGTNSGSGQPGGTGGYQRSYTSSSGNTYVYAPNFIIYGSMDPEDLRSLMDDGYERFCEYVEKYERERKRMDYGT